MATDLMVRDDIASQVGSDVIRGKDPDASGDPIFKSGVLEAGYTDITSLTNWDLYGAQVSDLDYRSFRNILVDDFVGSWGTLTDDEKKILIRNYVYPSGTSESELNALYPEVQRDQFRDDVFESLKVNSMKLAPTTDTSDPGTSTESAPGTQRIIGSGSTTVGVSATVTVSTFTRNAGERVLAFVFPDGQKSSAYDIASGIGSPGGLDVHYRFTKTTTADQMQLVVQNGTEAIKMDWLILGIAP